MEWKKPGADRLLKKKNPKPKQQHKMVEISPISKIGIDNDDVLFQFNEALFSFHNRIYGTSITLEEITTFTLSEIWKCSEEEEKERVFGFYNSEDIRKMPPHDGAVETVRRLAAQHDLLVITSRPRFILASTTQHVELHFPGIFIDVVTTNAYARDGLKRTKSEICLELGIATIVDDSLSNVRDCAQNGIRALLFRRPWNASVPDQALTEEGIIPVSSWHEVPEKI